MRPKLPDDLTCSVCKDLLKNAVTIPCCKESFCFECINAILRTSDKFECPNCNATKISPDSLMRNTYLRGRANDFMSERTSYYKQSQSPRMPDDLQPPRENQQTKQESSSDPGREEERSLALIDQKMSRSVGSRNVDEGIDNHWKADTSERRRSTSREKKRVRSRSPLDRSSDRPRDRRPYEVSHERQEEGRLARENSISRRTFPQHGEKRSQSRYENLYDGLNDPQIDTVRMQSSLTRPSSNYRAQDSSYLNDPYDRERPMQQIRLIYDRQREQDNAYYWNDYYDRVERMQPSLTGYDRQREQDTFFFNDPYERERMHQQSRLYDRQREQDAYYLNDYYDRERMMQPIQSRIYERQRRQDDLYHVNDPHYDMKIKREPSLERFHGVQHRKNMTNNDTQNSDKITNEHRNDNQQIQPTRNTVPDRNNKPPREVPRNSGKNSTLVPEKPSDEFSCIYSYCSKNTGKKYDKNKLRLHYSTEHGKELCDLCHKPFKSTRDLNEHTSNSHYKIDIHTSKETGRKVGMYKCVHTNCGKMFESETSMRKHINQRADH